MTLQSTYLYAIVLPELQDQIDYVHYSNLLIGTQRGLYRSIEAIVQVQQTHSHDSIAESS
jgi:hypothetical protein